MVTGGGNAVTPADRSVRVRPAAVAGRFYPDEPTQLLGVVAHLLDHAKAPPIAPKALIAPHAGYVYSGSVAAEAFATLKGARDVARVIVVGPAHYVAFRGVAFPHADAFETPLGRVPVDRDALAAIDDLAVLVVADAPHIPEHALEVELPFLQTVLGRFALVPLVVGEASPEEVAGALGRLWGGPETLVVVSSDLSHYLAYDAARRLDMQTAAAIECGEWRSLSPDRACGHLAIAGLLTEVQRRGLVPHRLALASSGDTAGPRSSVVGYGAWAFIQP
jgi:AmmeMemoRadiSam system protein B